MNNIRATKKINEVELENALRSGATGASWHDEYKDSAYIFVGGLPQELTEGDVITIFSQFGEVMDINMPREKDTGKRRGFGFLMYEDQRSTVLAVDNLNGADILGRTIRVDHVRQYKQKGERGEDGEWKEPEKQSLNAAPALAAAGGASSKRTGSDSEDEEEASADEDVDLDDPMAAYFAQKRKEDKLRGGSSNGGKASTATARAVEKEAKRQRKEERARKRARKEERRREKEGPPPADSGRSRERDRERDRDADSRSRDSHRDRDRGRHRDWDRRTDDRGGGGDDGRRGGYR
ncbi:RNA-binding protein Cwf29 [Tilletia horrida]|nr:RNA-binding protein Cwf29 [Tilletia horrida]